MAQWRADKLRTMRSHKTNCTLSRFSHLWLWGVVLLVVDSLYAQVGTFGFLWDDDQIIYGRPDYRDPSRWLGAVRQPLDFSPNYFRPLALTTLLMQIWIWQDIRHLSTG